MVRVEDWCRVGLSSMVGLTGRAITAGQVAEASIDMCGRPSGASGISERALRVIGCRLASGLARRRRRQDTACVASVAPVPQQGAVVVHAQRRQHSGLASEKWRALSVREEASDGRTQEAVHT